MRVSKREFGSIRTLTPIEVKRADADRGTFEGYASVFGAVDSFGERTERGCFADSLAKHQRDGTPVLMLWTHDPGEPVGVWDELAEDDHGLFVKGRLLTGVKRADELRVLLTNKAVSGLSIGYRVAPEGRRANGDGTTSLTRVDLLEISLVALPALPVARVTQAKAAEHFNAIEDFERHLRSTGLPGGMAKKVALASWPVLRADGQHCSFCERHKSQVGALMAGKADAAFICGDCAADAAETVLAASLNSTLIIETIDRHAKALAALTTKGN